MSAKRVRPRIEDCPAAPQLPPSRACPAPSPPPEWVAKLAALGQSPLGYMLASLLVLLPCYWQARIQAGDLSSHIYNSWLAQLIEAGKLPGLVVVESGDQHSFRSGF